MCSYKAMEGDVDGRGLTSPQRRLPGDCWSAGGSGHRNSCTGSSRRPRGLPSGGLPAALSWNTVTFRFRQCESNALTRMSHGVSY
jgi:hypothetical protein